MRSERKVKNIHVIQAQSQIIEMLNNKVNELLIENASLKKTIEYLNIEPRGLDDK